MADYMTECLLHPEHGYYTTREPFGHAGDFITAPEISQMFGELVGLALAQAWQDQGAPTGALLVELGPGRGTLMSDILRVLRAVPGARDALRPQLVEASPALRQRQAETLAPLQADPVWHDTLASLPEAPLFLVANEFLDALPIRQWQRGETGWQERRIGAPEGALNWGLAPEAPVPALSARLDDTTPGQIVETCAPAEAAVAQIAARISRHGGAALFIDYGDWRSRGDTLQALRDKTPSDPLEGPGLSDLTAHVAFEPLAVAAQAAGARASALVPQGVFLERLGITPRAQALARTLEGPALDSHVAAHRRLTHPAEMGTLFKCLAMTPDGAEPFPALAS